MNAIFSVLRGGIAWRLLPTDLPPKSTALSLVAPRRDTGGFETIDHQLVLGSEAPPALGVLACR